MSTRSQLKYLRAAKNKNKKEPVPKVDSQNESQNDSQESDDLIFDNFDMDMNEAIQNYQPPSSSSHKLRLNDSYSVPNATLAAGIDFNDSYSVPNATLAAGIGFNDSYTVPNATLAAGIDMDHVGSIAKSVEYYNNMFHGVRQLRLNHNHSHRRPLRNERHLNTMMDYMTYSQPLNGRNNLLALKYNHNPKGKEPEIYDFAHSYSRRNYASSISSHKSTDNAAFDPNLNPIPSYKSKKSLQRRNSNNFPNDLSFTPMNKPISVHDDHDDHEDSDEDDHLELKIDSYKSHYSYRPPSSLDQYYGCSYASTTGSINTISTMNSSVLAKTSQYIPDASLPYLVKTIDHHLVHTDNHQDSTDNLQEVYNLKGGDVAHDVYVFNEKIKKNIANKRSKSEPSLYELNKKKEGEFNISEIAVPGGFRRAFMKSKAKKQGKNPPHWITSNFIDFLALYGHYAGDDDFDEDYSSEYYGEDEESDDKDTESEMDLVHHNKFDGSTIDDERIKFIETQSCYEVSTHKPEFNIKIDNMTEKTPLLANSSHSSYNNIKKRTNKSKKNNSSAQVGTASEGKTLFLLLKAFVGTGILFLPKAFANGGLLFSLLLLAFSGWLSYFTMILLVRCSEKFGGSYGDIGKQLFGKPFKCMIQFSIALTQSGFCCAYIIFVLQNLKSIIGDSFQIPDWALVVAQILIYIPLSWIRKIQNFSFTSLIADVIILIGLVYILCADLIIVSSEGPSNTVKYFNRDDFPLFLGTAIYAYEGIGLIIPLQRSMKEPEKFPKVLKHSMYIVSLSMFLVGGLSYYIFGDKINTIVFMNVFPDSYIGITVRAFYALAIVFSFPLTLYSGIHIVEPLFIPRQKPSKSFQLRYRKLGSKKYITMTSNYSKEPGYNSINSSSNSNSSPSTSEVGRNSEFIKWMKNLFRAVFVSFLGFISYYGAKNLDNVVSLIGSFACIPLMFIYPAMMHYRGVAQTTSERIVDIAVIIFGIISTAWITKLSIEGWN